MGQTALDGAQARKFDINCDAVSWTFSDAQDANLDSESTSFLTQITSQELNESYTAQHARNGLPSDNSDCYLRLTLASKVYELAEQTPLTRADALSWRLQRRIFFKREDCNTIGSYKIRGVYNMMAHLPGATRWKGVITYSRGNHGLAVVSSAKKLRIPSLVVLPISTPESIHQRLSRLGATVVLFGSSLEAAKEECLRLQELYGLTYVPTSENAHIVAGHGTIGLEILAQADISCLGAIFCPVACGALIAGVGTFVKRVAPQVNVIGVEHSNDDHMSWALRQRKELSIGEQSNPSRFSKETIEICRHVVDDIVLVNDQEIASAIKDAFDDTRHILQPGGALATAGVVKWITASGVSRDKMDIVAITSEANVDFSMVPSLIRLATDQKIS